MSWHIDPAVLDGYLEGVTDVPTTLSVEAHLATCATCRAKVGADPAWVEATWERIVETVDAPEWGRAERMLLRLGLKEDLVRLLTATPSLRWSWLAAVWAALSFAVLAARATHGNPRGLLVFLVIAPILPVAGVAVAYGPGMDPFHESAMATPMDGFRLLLLRAAAVLVSTLALTAAAAPLLPRAGWMVAAWLLPACALTAAALALASRFPTRWAAGTVIGAWLTAVTLSTTAGNDGLALFRSSGQVWILALLLAAGTTLFARRRAFDIGGA